MPSEASATSWSHLLCGGPNGILLVILALAWQMKYHTETNSSMIEEAAIDVTWVLAQLMLAFDTGKGGKKRELEVEPRDDLPSSKRYLILSSHQIKKKTNKN